MFGIKMVKDPKYSQKRTCNGCAVMRKNYLYDGLSTQHRKVHKDLWGPVTRQNYRDECDLGYVVGYKEDSQEYIPLEPCFKPTRRDHCNAMSKMGHWYAKAKKKEMESNE